MTDEIDDIDLQYADSTCRLHVTAHKHETVPDEISHFGRPEFQHEGQLKLSWSPGKNLINVEAYFDRAWLSDLPNELGSKRKPDRSFWSVSYVDATLVTRLYEEEIQKAARVRAGEDGDDRHSVHVLAKWLCLSRADHVDDYTPMKFQSALKAEVKQRDDVPDDWEVNYHGSIDVMDSSRTCVTTLDEAKRYARGGMDAVYRSRKSADNAGGDDE